MHFTMPPALPEVKKEINRLHAEWYSQGELDDIVTEDYDLNAYCKQYGSKALRDYERMRAEIRASLQPGEYV